MIELSGRTILVTGAAGGIGAATARRLASLGADLVLHDIAECRPLAAEIVAETGRDVVLGTSDLSTPAGLAELVQASAHVDGLVYCAGICPLDDWMHDPQWEDTFERVMRVNLVGALALIRALAPAMASRGHGRIVLIGSTAARTGGATPELQPHYSASKAAVHAVVRQLARRWVRSGILVNGVAPGSIGTSMNVGMTQDVSSYPMQRWGTCDEVAWPIAFLCSAAASYICGAVLDVNGGTFIAD